MANKTTFFQKVSQFVSTIASPKQPQSVTGFLIARISVNGVKNPMNSKAPHAAHLVLMFRNKAIPIKNSAKDNINEKKMALPSIQLR